MSTYLLVNLLSVSVPLTCSFHRRLNFYRTWYAFWPAAIITAAFFITWDILFTRLGVWGFNERHLIGITLLDLPLEEWLFFICIPYACVFTYASLKQVASSNFLEPYRGIITVCLIAGCVVLASMNIGRLYTSVTSLLTAFFLLAHLMFIKRSYLSRFYLAYSVLLVPFFIVNGILTGSFIHEEVVWYNNAENLSVRLFTIPVEDLIYCLLLLLMNVTLYEAFVTRRISRK